MAQIINDFSTLLETISFLPDTTHISVAAISGFGGSGKTTLAHKVAEKLPDAAVVSADDFVLSNYQARSDSWDCIDRQRIINEVLQPAQNGSEISFLAYDWRLHESKINKSVGKPKILLLEGIGIIHPDLLPYFNFSIWLNVQSDVAAERGMKRDKEILHTDNYLLWRDVWMPNDQDYFNKYYPHTLVDYIYEDSKTAAA